MSGFWEHAHEYDTGLVKVMIGRLRKKLEKPPADAHASPFLTIAPMKAQTEDTNRNIHRQHQRLNFTRIHHFPIIATTAGDSAIGSDRTLTTH